MQSRHEDTLELLRLELHDAACIDPAFARTDMAAEPGARPCARWYGRQKGGVPHEKAMARAFKAGAYWWQIGDYFGISQQAAYEAAKKARRTRR